MIDIERIDKAYQAIVEKAKSQKSTNSLAIIKTVCDQQLQSQENNFTISNIGKLSQKADGPTERTIRNKTGALYQELICVYRDATSKDKASTIRNDENAWVDGIENPSIRWLVRDLIRDKAKLIGENNQFRHELLNAEVPINISDNSSESVDKSPSQRKQVLTDTEINSLKSAIDSEYLKRKGLSMGDKGEIRNSDGRILFNFGFVNAIEKALDIEGGSL